MNKFFSGLIVIILLFLSSYAQDNTNQPIVVNLTNPNSAGQGTTTASAGQETLVGTPAVINVPNTATATEKLTDQGSPTTTPVVNFTNVVIPSDQKSTAPTTAIVPPVVNLTNVTTPSGQESTIEAGATPPVVNLTNVTQAPQPTAQETPTAPPTVINFTNVTQAPQPTDQEIPTVPPTVINITNVTAPSDQVSAAETTATIPPAINITNITAPAETTATIPPVINVTNITAPADQNAPSATIQTNETSTTGAGPTVLNITNVTTPAEPSAVETAPEATTANISSTTPTLNITNITETGEPAAGAPVAGGNVTITSPVTVPIPAEVTNIVAGLQDAQNCVSQRNQNIPTNCLTYLPCLLACKPLNDNCITQCGQAVTQPDTNCAALLNLEFDCARTTMNNLTGAPATTTTTVTSTSGGVA